MRDTRAWLVWAVAVLVVASSTRNPLYALLLMLIVMVTDAAHPREEGARQLPSALRFAAVAVPLAALLNALISRIGDTVLVRVPSGLPVLGGPITLEALLFGATNGLVLTLIYGGFALVNRVTPVHEWVRLAPRAFHEVGVVLTVALTFIPQTIRHLRRIRDAQALRGHRVRGLRDWAPIVVPLLVSGLERSMGLAEAMVARGYGAVAARDQSPRVKVLLAAGLLALLAGWLGRLLYAPQRLVAGVLAAGGALIVLLAVWLAGRGVRRSAYRVRRPGWRDVLGVLGCAAALAPVVLPRVAGGTLYYTPYPRLTLPPVDLLVAALLLGLLAPALLSAAGEQP